MNSPQIVDLVVLAALLYCAIKGASRGLLSQLAWVVALLLCFKFSGTLAPAIEPMIMVDPPLKQWIAMLAVYVGLCLASFFAAGMLSTWMEKAKIKDFDRHLGGVLGLMKGIIFCMSVMYFVITMSQSMRQIVSRTYSGYAAAVILHNSQYLVSLVPEHRVRDVREVIDRFNQHLQPDADDLNGARPTGPGLFDEEDALSGNDSGDFDLSELFPEESDSGTRNDTEAAHGSREPSFQDLLAVIPTDLRRQLTMKTLDALRNSSADDRRQLVSQLKNSLPESAGSILNRYLRSSSVLDEQGQGGADSHEVSSAPPPLGRTESLMLDEIAGIYSRRSDIVPRARQYLAGVPSSVQRRVLDDWHADAMGLRSDPDRGTDVNTPLDERILRQLQKSGISLEKLDRDLRARLSQADP